MALTKIFKNGNSQAVRIPAEFAYERADLDVEIERIGDEIRIRPARQSLEKVMSKFAQFSTDFMSEGRGKNCLLNISLLTASTISLQRELKKERYNVSNSSP